jgi:hypothetical protein
VIVVREKHTNSLNNHLLYIYIYIYILIWQNTLHVCESVRQQKYVLRHMQSQIKVTVRGTLTVTQDILG